MSNGDEMSELEPSPADKSRGAVYQDEPDRRAQSIDAESPPRLAFPVVAIGGSAGGLEAAIEFFEAMAPDAGMAYILVQHLPPDRESMIASVLGRHTSMPVGEIEDGMVVEPDHVYVIRPGYTVTIESGKLRLGRPLADRGNDHPVDDLFRSLAHEQRERGIAIVLSGMGSNGSAGAAEVKAVGGVVIAQDPESAKFPSMPRNLVESGQADFVLRPEEMPGVLLRYTSHPYVRNRPSEETFAQTEAKHLGEIITVLRTRTRRDFSGYKKPTVMRRIQRRMSLNHMNSLSEYAKFLRQNASEVSALSDDLMIHVTGFFRDPTAWDSLTANVIVPLVAEREDESSIRCWVSACSSGEEAYTLAMLLVEAAEAADKTFDIKVFATDTADRTLAKARSGTYPMGIETEIVPSRLERFFERDDSMYRVKNELRELVVFAPQDIIQDPPFSRLDICTCRNLLIYLEPEVQQRVLGLLHFGLRQGGALFLGTSETVGGMDELWEPIDKRSRIYRRIGPTRPGSVEFGLPKSRREYSQDPAGRYAPPIPVSQVTDRLLLVQYTPAAVVVDRTFRIVYFHGDTTPFLSHPRGEPTRDLMALAREELRGSLRTALQHSMSENEMAHARDGVIETSEGRKRIEIRVVPLEPALAPGHWLVTFETYPDPAPLEPMAGEPTDTAHLQSELHRIREELQSTIEELQTSNEELKASNEEAMSVNEELQSSNEELETSKEELQSLNEELTTVNVQLQNKIEEHEATSSDLASLLSSTNIAVVFLDTRMRIRRYTPAVRDLFELIPGDVDRPISDMAKKFTDSELLKDCQAVLDRLVPIEREVSSASDRIYLRTVLPYRTSDNRITGTVITFVDITAIKLAEQALRESEQRFKLVIDGAPDFAMLLMNLDGTIATWSTGAERMLGYSKEEAIGRTAAMIYPPEGGAAQLHNEMRQAAELGRAVDESWHIRKSGARLWGSGVLSALCNEQGEVTGFVKVLRDETARKRAEADRAELLIREQAARREAEIAIHHKDHFLATVSHELRTPLSAILLWAQLLRQGKLSEEERAEGYGVIERSADAQRQLLDDILETARITSGKVRLELEEVDLRQMIQVTIEAVHLSALEKDIAIETSLGAEVGTMPVDPDRIRQVISNLLTNAVKFTPPGGRIRVELRRTDGFAEIRVCDTGRGIAAEFLPHLFVPFTQAESKTSRTPGSLGLGLSICKELVELHGGAIWAESEGVGQGATFIVSLPVEPVAAEKVRPRESPPEPLSIDVIRGSQIILVEDDRATREALLRLLTSAGATTRAAENVPEALAAIAERPPDLLISDIGLPGQDGYELLEKVRAMEKEAGQDPVPAIALTAFAGTNDRRHAYESGFHQHIAKPVDPGALLAAVARFIFERFESRA